MKKLKGVISVFALSLCLLSPAQAEEQRYISIRNTDMVWVCSGQQKLATALEFFQYRFSDSFGGNPPLYSCGLSAL